jgi:ribosomal protein L28
MHVNGIKQNEYLVTIVRKGWFGSRKTTSVKVQAPNKTEAIKTAHQDRVKPLSVSAQCLRSIK